MLLLEEKIQKMEQKNLGEMVFAAEVGLPLDGDGDGDGDGCNSIAHFSEADKEKTEGWQKRGIAISNPYNLPTVQICSVPSVTLFNFE